MFKETFRVFKSILLVFRHRILFILRIFVLLLAFLILLSLTSIIYYSFYCTYRYHEGLHQASKRHLWNINDGVRDKFMPILIPACDRPHYLKRVLDGLSQVDGINETLVIVSQDCGQVAVKSVLQSVPSYVHMLILTHVPPFFSLPRYVDTNEYATSANVKFLLEFAFEHMLADGAILLESDLIPSVDFYRYHQWAYRHLLAVNNSKILSVHAFNLHSTNHSDPYELFQRGFDSWGWSTARTKWNWLKTQWTIYNGWDTVVSRKAAQNDLVCLIPKLSRTRMIGLKGINVNVKTDWEAKQFEEGMYMSDKVIDYKAKIPKIVTN